MRYGGGSAGSAAAAMHAIGMQWIVLGCAAIILIAVLWYFEKY